MNIDTFNKLTSELSLINKVEGPWNDFEEKRLYESYFNNRLSVIEIAKLHERNVESILNKLINKNQSLFYTIIYLYVFLC